jgi:uncharacterized membrane protein (UPF0127 family)
MRTSVASALGLAMLLAVGGCAAKLERVPLTVGSAVFMVEVARTDAQRERGLMHRRSLGSREGMLFVFDADQRLAFWMKDTLVPLSIAFLSSEGRILQIEDMEPLSQKAIRSRLSARYALELPRGAFTDVGAAEGGTVALPAGLR